MGSQSGSLNLKNRNMKDLFDLDGKVIVVTGATGVLAGGTAHYLQENGAKVVYLGRNHEKWMLHWLRPKQYPMNAWA